MLTAASSLQKAAVALRGRRSEYTGDGRLPHSSAARGRSRPPHRTAVVSQARGAALARKLVRVSPKRHLGRHAVGKRGCACDSPKRSCLLLLRVQATLSTEAGESTQSVRRAAPVSMRTMLLEDACTSPRFFAPLLEDKADLSHLPVLIYLPGKHTDAVGAAHRRCRLLVK